jgi:hypothetical protein
MRVVKSEDGRLGCRLLERLFDAVDDIPKTQRRSLLYIVFLRRVDAIPILIAVVKIV